MTKTEEKTDGCMDENPVHQQCSKTVPLSEFREHWDWKEVLGYAGKDGTQQGGQPAPGAVGESPPSTEPFGMDDVEEVLAADEGENDGPSWMVALRLKDGRFAYIEAGCDYTGWDCQAGGSASVASSLEQLVRFGLTDEARKRLGLR